MFAIMLQTDVMSTWDKWDKALSYLYIMVDANVLGKVGVSWGVRTTIDHSVVQNMPSDLSFLWHLVDPSMLHLW